MITDYFSELNWLAVLVATIAWFAFSAIWYSIPPLSKAWQKAARVDPNEGGNFVAILVKTFLVYLVTTIVVALLVVGLDVSDLTGGIVLGALLGLGFGMAGAKITQMYENRASGYWLINGVNAVIAMSIVGAILAVWR
jgi:hypothetical protein